MSINMTTTTSTYRVSVSTYRVSINFKDKVILLTKPLKECEYFKHTPYYIDGTYTINNETINVHKDFDNYREYHFTPNYKTAKLLFNQLKNTKKGYFFYNSLEN